MSMQISALFAHIFWTLTFIVGSTVAFSNEPIVLSGRRVSKDAQLVLFVPGGKVPPEDYIGLLNATQQRSKANLWVAIVRCGKLNLCNPLGGLNGEIQQALDAATTANGGNIFPASNTFVAGHSLGGVGARHYVDIKGDSNFAGLMLFGTQYNGDNENLSGTLGYPQNLQKFRMPFLALLGELDMVPTSHAAKLYSQWVTLSPTEQSEKPIIIVPGMDHSQFCSPFKVSGDLAAEITNAAATEISGMVIASFVDGLVLNDKQAKGFLIEKVQEGTKNISQAWIEASMMEQAEWCVRAQRITTSYLPQTVQSRIKNISVLVRDSNPSLEHGHTNITLDPADGSLHLRIVAKASYGNSSFNPVSRFAPNYASASDIACKMLSGDQIAKASGLKRGDFWPAKHPNITCTAMNQQAWDIAISLLQKYWPSAYKRWQAQGRKMEFDADHNTIAGPQWVFLSSLTFDEQHTTTDRSKPVKVSSSALYSASDSKIFPGNFYCKLLSPAKVVEWIQTTGLTKRFS